MKPNKALRGGLSLARIILLAGVVFAFPPFLCRAQTIAPYTISTVAGNGTSGFSGDAGAASSAQLNTPSAVAVDRGSSLFIADQANQRVRKVASGGTISTLAGNGTAAYLGDTGIATSAELHAPYSVALDSSGNVYIADTFNNVVRKVSTAGIITTVAGFGGLGYSGDSGPAIFAAFNRPLGVALDAAGNIYIADTGNNVIRKVSTSGTITTIAGVAFPAYAGDGGLATKAYLNAPSRVTPDAAGNLYIVDTGNEVIRKVDSAGIITTIAGDGTCGYSGDFGPASSARLCRPRDLVVDSSGNLFIADSFNSRIRRVGADGIITTIAGNGVFGYTGDGGPALAAALFFPNGLALDAGGNIYFADSQNHVIRKLTPAAAPVPGGPPVILSGGVTSLSGFGGSGSIAPGSWIEIHGWNLAGNTRSWAIADFNGLNAPAALDGTTVTIDGQPAFLSYISPNQLNALVPSDVSPGLGQLIVSTAAGSSDSYPLTVNPTQPGLLATPPFYVNQKQYVVAVFPDFGTFVAPPGAIPGVLSRQAKPGETIVLFGIGFGQVTPNIPAGQIVQQLNSVNSALQFFIGNKPAVIEYAGLAPFSTGLYQFNLVVPIIAADDVVPVTVTVDGVSGEQTLYTAIGN
jgi:uncharacterized protein (TIGR03437 family)